LKLWMPILQRAGRELGDAFFQCIRQMVGHHSKWA
jgi:predicted nuclease with TOPRIM domain